MPRKAKGIHTNPSNSGEDNLPDNYAEKNPDKGDTMAGLMPLYRKSVEYLKEYKGLWEDDKLAEVVNEYFEYCYDNNVKPCKAGIRMYIGISRSQYWEWENKPEKYGSKSDILRVANDLIESSYIGRAEKYPTANIFLLKTSHQHIETSKIDLQSNTNVQSEDIKDLISKMGLDKTK